MLGELIGKSAQLPGGDVFNPAKVAVKAAGEVTAAQGTSTAAATTPLPAWTTAYSASNYTNNNLGNNGTDPSMQATLNDPHAAILAPPAPQVSAAALKTIYGGTADAHPTPLPGGGSTVPAGMALPGMSGARSMGVTEPGDPAFLALREARRAGQTSTQPFMTNAPQTNPVDTLAAQYAKAPNRVVRESRMTI